MHTPASHVHNYGRGDGAWDAFLEDLESLPADITTIGINDYLTIAGYRRLLEERRNGRLQNIHLMLPVVELRIRRFAGQGHWKRVNYHVVFSDDVDVQTIENEFLSTITSSYTLGDGKEWSGPPLRSRLEELGRMVKDTAPDPTVYPNDFQTGMDSFNVDPESVEAALASTAFRGKFLTAIGKVEWDQMVWTPASAAEKRSVIGRADFLFTACATSEAFERSRETLRANTVNDRLLHCSDAHSLSTSEETCRLGHCMTWVKAQPSFDGLLLARHEYDERVFVGEEPPQLRSVREHPTRYIASVQLRGPTADSWFQSDAVPLNPGLVAVIGNKGGGKSAFTDAVALVADADVEGHLSFLNTTRFRHPLSGRASEHTCEIVWESGDAEQKPLSAPVDTTKPERVRYLPQNYFERLCSEIGAEAYEEFERQLKHVVFSWLPVDRRLGQTSLDSLIDRIAGEWRERHRLRKSALAELNVRVAAAERVLQPNAVRDLRNQLAEKQRELEAHILRKPAPEIDESVERAAQEDPALNEIRALEENITALGQKVEAHAPTLAALRNNQQTINDLEQRFSNVEYYVAQQLQNPDAEQQLRDLGVELSAVLTFRIDRGPITTVAEQVKMSIQKAVEAQESDLLAHQEAVGRRDNLVTQLDERRRERREAQEALVRWEQQRAQIEGAPETPGTLSYLQAVLARLAQVAQDLESLESQRHVLFGEIFDDLASLRDSYRELFAPVQAYLEAEPLLSDGLAMRVDTVIRNDGFASRFISFMDRSKKGAFFQMGEEDFDALSESADFNDKESTKQFVTEIVRRLRPMREMRPEDDVDRQLRAGVKREAVYDWVFGLDYLQPHYALRFNEKEIAQLSPGERGAALLIFYLLVDRSLVPILLDQPEENLDNETVSRLLVPAIREARKRRQVILVTHNPNLAVYCDADQVVLAELSRGDATRISYHTGAIENLETRRWLVNVLEGTGRAFLKRHDKYAVGAGGELVLRST